MAGEKVSKPVELQEGMEIDFGVVVYDEDGETGLVCPPQYPRMLTTASDSSFRLEFI